MRRIYLLLLIAMPLGLFAQKGNFWKSVSSSRLNSPKKERVTIPSTFKTYQFDAAAFQQYAANVGRRFDFSRNQPTLKVTLPLADGTMEEFTLQDAELMHPDLARKFPELRTYVGKGINDGTANVRITYSPYHGFNGMILSAKHPTTYIDPYTKDNENYMVYSRESVSKSDRSFICETNEGLRQVAEMENYRATGDCNLRRYRLAQSCTGEYAQYHITQAGGTTGNTTTDKAIVQSAMNVTMNRVNGIYENDLGITMQFVANNNLIIYLDASTDPWTNEWNTKTAQTIDAQIGVNNYDIGHNFNTTGGGNAGCINCVCLSTSQNNIHKGRGYTGSSTPVGDPFDIDYVAHEMGHQFGGYHTQSNSTCRSGDGTTEVEPGSGSTVMGYAGICPANVQNASDDYFHYVNIRDIVANINSASNSGACDELITSGNTGPTASAGADYSIPISTPFLLTGTGSDPNDSGLTYCWEENDPENPNSSAAPTSTRTQGPMFRSFRPVAVPYRYFPRLADVVANVSPTWEVLPSVSRTMDFAFTVRDNNSVSGCTASDLMTVTTVAAAGPFLVTAPNTAVSWNSGSSQTITWNVANTTAAPVSCANVDIYLSTDGGLTYPTLLASNVPNDGSQAITVPNVSTTTARVMIFCSNNIFYDISNTNFTIVSVAPDFSIAATPSSVSVCAGTSANYTINLTAISGFSSSVALSASGNPSGSTVSFSPASVTPTGSSTMTVSGTPAAGSYTITVTGTGGSPVLTHTTTVTYNVSSGAVGATTLTAPADAATNVSTAPTFSWAAASGAATYDLQVSTDNTFASTTINQTGLATTTYNGSGLASATTYYWRVRGVNGCGAGAWSSIFSFTTISVTPCNQYAAGPYIDFGNVACYPNCATPYEITAFQVYANESYLLYGLVGGGEYEFSFCNGYNSATWSANVSVYEYNGGTIGAHLNTTSGCSNTFTRPTTGDVIVIIWTTCGAAEIQTNNGFPSIRCTGNGTKADCMVCEDFSAGSAPAGWSFTQTSSNAGRAVSWLFDTNTFGTTAPGTNLGDGNWANFDDDSASGSARRTATALTPTIDLSGKSEAILSFKYTYREYDSAPQEFLRLRAWNGTQWQYWNGTAWGATAVDWLNTTDSRSIFSVPLTGAFLNSAFKAELFYDNGGTSGWEWGFGFDDFQVCSVTPPPPCVDDLVESSNPIPSDSYEADLTITSAGVVPSGNTVSFESQLITLQAGFHAQAGCDFHAFIGQCPPARLGNTASTYVAGVPAELTKGGRSFGNDTKEAKGSVSRLDVQVIPNPFANKASVRYYLANEGEANVTLTDLNGRVVRNLLSAGQMAAGWHETTIEGNGLAKGIYMLNVRTATESTTKKVVLVH